MASFESMRRISRLYHSGLSTADECARLIILIEPDPEKRTQLAEEYLSSDQELLKNLEAKYAH